MQPKKHNDNTSLPKKAIILAGGLGTRLRPLTLTVPKPMIDVNGKTLTEHILDILKKYEINEVYLSVSYLGHKIQEYVGNGIRQDGGQKDFGVKINYLNEEKPMGTAGPLLILKREKRLQELNETFVMLNGDNLFSLDFKKMYELHKKNNAVATIGLTRVEDPSKYGVVRIDNKFNSEKSDKSKNNKDFVKILEFVEKPKKENAPSNLISSGYYILEPEVFDYLPEKDFAMMEKEVWPALAKAGKLFGFISDGQWFDTGTMEAYETVKKEWKGV